MYEVKISGKAEKDLLKIRNYSIENYGNADAALRILSRIRDGIFELESFPKRYINLGVIMLICSFRKDFLRLSKFQKLSLFIVIAGVGVPFLFAFVSNLH